MSTNYPFLAGLYEAKVVELIGREAAFWFIAEALRLAEENDRQHKGDK